MNIVHMYNLVYVNLNRTTFVIHCYVLATRLRHPIWWAQEGWLNASRRQTDQLGTVWRIPKVFVLDWQHGDQNLLSKIVILEFAFVRKTISCSLFPLGHHLSRNRFQVPGPTNSCEKINQTGSQVESVVAQFTGFVIIRKHMMVVVPTLSQSCDWDWQIVGWIDVSVTHQKRMLQIK